MKLAPLLSLVPAVGAVLAGAADDETDFVLAQTSRSFSRKEGRSFGRAQADGPPAGDAHPDDLVNLRHFAQHAAAAYCNVGKESGQALRCNGGACPAVEASGAVVFASFRYVPPRDEREGERGRGERRKGMSRPDRPPPQSEAT